jgi:hypothetical protein
MMAEEDWAEIEKKLGFPWGRVKLMCDGYELTIDVQMVKPLRYMLMVYVNGIFRGEWLLTDGEERRRFMREHRACALKKKERDFWKKNNQRLPKKLRVLDPDRKFSWWEPLWSSFKQLKAHLIKNNKEISLVRDEIRPEEIQLATAGEIMAATVGVGGWA